MYGGCTQGRCKNTGHRNSEESGQVEISQCSGGHVSAEPVEYERVGAGDGFRLSACGRRCKGVLVFHSVP